MARRVRWHQKLNAAGWVGISWPQEYGGRGASDPQNSSITKSSSARDAAALHGMGIIMLGPTLIHWGTEEQKKRHVPKILAGKEIWCQGYSEPNSGSDLASLQTRAVEQGDDFVVNGQKVWTSIAQHADWIFLLVRTDPNAPKHKGISYLLVDMHSPGITVRPLVQITGGKGFNEVFFEDVRVPKKNIVGELNQGWQVAITTLMFERSGGSGEIPMREVHELADLAKRIPRNGGTRMERFQRAPKDHRVRLRCGGAQVHRLSPAHAPAQRNSARAGRLDDEAVQHGVAPADGDVRDGTARAVQPDGGRRAICDRSGQVVIPNAGGAWADDLRGHQSDSAQHHRRKSFGITEGLIVTPRWSRRGGAASARSRRRSGARRQA